MDQEAGMTVWRARLRSAVSGHGGPSAVARLAEIPLQTLKNHLSGRTKRTPLEDLNKVAAALALSPAWLAGAEDGSRSEPTGLGEGDVRAYEGPGIGLAAGPAAGIGRWTVTSRALDLAAVLPGDVLEFSLGTQPRAGDVVVAQLYDDESGTARTVIRLFQPPVLLTRSSDPAVESSPILLDPAETRVKVMGVLARLHRQAR